MNVRSSIFRHHRVRPPVMVDFLSELSKGELELTVPVTYGSSIDTIRRRRSGDADYVRITPDTPEVPQFGEDGSFEG